MNTLRIDMAPVAKGRARVAVRDARAHAYTPSKTVDAEERIRWAFRQSKQDKIPESVPIAVVVTFFIQKPKSCPKSRLHPVVKPDLDNMEKLVLDALNGFAWHDDSQIVTKMSTKAYVNCDPYIDVTWEPLTQ